MIKNKSRRNASSCFCLYNRKEIADGEPLCSIAIYLMNGRAVQSVEKKKIYLGSIKAAFGSSRSASQGA